MAREEQSAEQPATTEQQPTTTETAGTSAHAPRSATRPTRASAAATASAAASSALHTAAAASAQQVATLQVAGHEASEGIGWVEARQLRVQLAPGQSPQLEVIGLESGAHTGESLADEDALADALATFGASPASAWESAG